MPKLVKSTRPPWLPERKAHTGRKKPNKDIYNNYNYRKRVTLHKKRNPYCVHCEAKGIVSPVVHTDHIIPINQGADPYDERNWQSLCKRCHDVKSGQESAASRRGGLDV